MKKLETADDLIDLAHKLLDAFKEKRKELNFDEVLGRILANATEPDDRFKCDELVRIISNIERGEEKINYLYRLVKFEGMLQRKLDGKVYLNDIAIPEGTTVEFMQNDSWAIGYLRKNPKTIGMSIFDRNGNMVIETINQVKARVR